MLLKKCVSLSWKKKMKLLSDDPTIRDRYIKKSEYLNNRWQYTS